MSKKKKKPSMDEALAAELGETPSPPAKEPAEAPKPKAAEPVAVMTLDAKSDAIRRAAEAGLSGVNDFMETSDSFGENIPDDIPKTINFRDIEEEVVPVWKTEANLHKHRRHQWLVPLHRSVHAMPHGPMSPHWFDSVTGAIHNEDAILCLQVKRRAEELDRAEKDQLNRQNEMIFGKRTPVNKELQEAVASEEITASISRDWPESPKG